MSDTTEPHRIVAGAAITLTAALRIQRRWAALDAAAERRALAECTQSTKQKESTQ